MSFFVCIFDGIFCGTIFFNFEDSVWLVKSTWCVNCCFIRQIYWVGDSCRSEFELWWFFVRKKIVVTVLAVFLSFWSWLPDIIWVFTNLKDSGAFLGLVMPLKLVKGTWEGLIIDFTFFLESCLFMCLSVMRFFSLHVFPCLITVTGWHSFFDLLIFVHIFNSTSVGIVALSNSRWSDFVSIKLSQIGSFHYLLVLATECFFSFDIFEIPSDAFSGC